MCMSENEVEVIPILKSSFKSLIKEPGFIGLYLLPYIVLVIATAHLWWILGTLDMTPTISSSLQTFLIENIVWIVIYAIGIALIGLTVYAAIILKAAARKRGKTLAAAEAVGRGISYIIPLLGVILLIGLFTIGPFFLFIILANKGPEIFALGILIWFIPMIYIGVRLSLGAQICVIKNLGPINSLKESWQITKGNFWLIFVTMLILSIMSGIISLIPKVGSLISALVIGPAGLIAITFIYLELVGEKS